MPRIAVVGAGPAGLSAARLLHERGFKDISIFESDTRVGGKSLSVRYRGSMLEMGTCYSTLDHATTNRWMRKFGIRQYALGKQMMDGKPFTNFIREGEGGSLFKEGMKYIRLWRAFTEKAKTAPNDPAFLEEAALPLDEWLQRNDLIRMRRFMLRGITAIGYDYIDRISTLQALRWVTPSLIFSGLFNQLKMPYQGWQYFWERVAEQFDIRLDEPVIGIERTDQDVTITTPTGAQKFDQVVLTIPMDDLADVMTLTDTERAIEQSIEWCSYVVSMVRVSDWFKSYTAESYQAALEPGAQMGRLMSARLERKVIPPDKKSRIYMCAQFGENLDRLTLADRLKDDIEAKGATFEALMFQRPWKYFPRYKLDAIRGGVVPLMQDVQGQNNTWYSGATFCHEAVSAVVSFNHGLVDQITEKLAA